MLSPMSGGFASSAVMGSPTTHGDYITGGGYVNGVQNLNLSPTTQYVQLPVCN